MPHKIIPVVIVAFVAVSFAAFDGWPFRRAARPGTGAPELSHRIDTSVPEVAPATVPVEGFKDESASAEKQDQGSAATNTDRQALLDQAREEGPDRYRKALAAAVLSDDGTDRERSEWLEELRRANRSDVLRFPTRLTSIVERIRSGDSLTTIAGRCRKAHANNVTAALIQRVNGLPTSRIRAGATLRVPTGRIEVLILKRDYRLYVMVGDEIVLDFPVGLGKGDSTPEGRFVIKGKTHEPTWTRPDGAVIPFGHPDHQIGTRWLGFADSKGGGTGYGIHGTVDDDSIGKQLSDGCVRLVNREVEELFDLVPEGCGVEVRR